MNQKNIQTTLIYSRQDTGSALTNGRINEGKVRSLVTHNHLQNAAAFFLCGPEEMIVEKKRRTRKKKQDTDDQMSEIID